MQVLGTSGITTPLVSLTTPAVLFSGYFHNRLIAASNFTQEHALVFFLVLHWPVASIDHTTGQCFEEVLLWHVEIVEVGGFCS